MVLGCLGVLLTIFLIIALICFVLGIGGLIFWGIGNFIIWAFSLEMIWTFWQGLACAIIFALLVEIFGKG